MLDHAGGGVGEAADGAACGVDALARARRGDVELDVPRGTGGGREEPRQRVAMLSFRKRQVFSTRSFETGQAHLVRPIPDPLERLVVPAFGSCRVAGACL